MNSNFKSLHKYVYYPHKNKTKGKYFKCVIYVYFKNINLNDAYFKIKNVKEDFIDFLDS